MTGDLNMGTTPHKILNLLSGTNPLEGVNKYQMDAADADKLDIAGTNSMTAYLNVGTHNIPKPQAVARWP